MTTNQLVGPTVLNFGSNRYIGSGSNQFSIIEPTLYYSETEHILDRYKSKISAGLDRNLKPW